MVYILVDEITKRVEYTLDFVFKERGIQYQLLIDEENFDAAEGVKLNYSSKPTKHLSIVPSSLLFETSINQFSCIEDDYHEERCLKINGVTDPIAAIFFTLSRYEEYVARELDDHKRFPLKSSVLFKYNLHRLAVCDRWSNKIIGMLKIESISKHLPIKIVPTFDIDNTYAYRLKKGKRKFLAIAKDIAKRDKERLIERKQVLNGLKDPYDTFDKIKSIALEFENTKVFWLVAELGQKDRNISIDNPEHQKLIQDIDRYCELGLHPGYASDSNSSKILIEKNKLESVLNREVNASRQHYLRVTFPDTYRSLLKAGFKHDYSMGFAEDIGFRCGTARPFYWFNLERNEVTDLMIHPFVYMDGTLNEYLRVSPDKAITLIDTLYKEVEQFGGDFVFLWHNETIGGYRIWKDWERVLEHTLKLGHE